MYDKHLDYFIMAADYGSFSKAAEKAYISPNAVIKQVNLLEQDLGITLFTRTSHGIRLTKAGESIYRDAKRIINISTQALETARNIVHSEAQTIRIGSSLLRPCKPIVNIWSSISINHPEIRLQVLPVDDSGDSIYQLLDNLGKEIDILASLIPSSLWQDRCNALELYNVPVMIGVPRNHRLSAKEKLKLSDLYGETLYIVKQGDTSYIDQIRHELKRKHPQIILEDVPPYDFNIFNLSESTGKLMLTANVWADTHPSLVTLPCEWEYVVPFGIVYSKEPSDKVMKFIEIIKAAR